MHESRGVSKIFVGVRFVLVGFDSVSEAQYRAELVHRGGVDVGRYESSCTHVIVSGRVYDDPVCVSARQDGKSLVTESWVDDCVNTGMLVDANRVLYRPVKDLNGIPGCERLCICLTGYQRQERDDIMKMVSLMGAQFSKPLIANQVTHLICYKFEGEKYELAKKVNIQLVNHRWLEDCLKAWEVLAIDNYTKSGWELEMLEAEARDSEEEIEDEHRRPLGQKSPMGASIMPVLEGSDISILSPKLFDVQHDSKEQKHLCNAEDLPLKDRLLSTPCKGTRSGDALNMCTLNSNALKDSAHQDAGCIIEAFDVNIKGDAPTGGKSDSCDTNIKKKRTLSPTAKVIKQCSPTTAVGEKFSRLIYSRKNSKMLDSAGETSNILQNSAGETLNTLQTSSPGNLEKGTFMGNCNFSPLASSETKANQTAGIRSPTTLSNTGDMESRSSVLKRKDFISSTGSKSLKFGCQGSKAGSPHSPHEAIRSMESKPTTALPGGKIDYGIADISALSDGDAIANSTENLGAVPSKPNSLNYKKRALKRGQILLGTNVPNTIKPPDAKLVDMPLIIESRQGSDEHMNAAYNLPLVTRTNNATVATINDSLMQDMPFDEQKQAAEVITSIKNTHNLGTPLTDEGNQGKTYQWENNSRSSSGGLLGSELVSNSESGGDIALGHMPNTTSKESRQLHRTQQNEGIFISDGRDSESRKLTHTTTDSIFKKTKSKASSGSHKKKVVAKNKVQHKPKLDTGNAEKGTSITFSDKSPTPNKAAVKLGKEGKARAESKQDMVTSSEENNTLDSVSNQEVFMDHKVNAMHHPVSERKQRNVLADRMRVNEEMVKVRQISTSGSRNPIIQEASMDPEKENSFAENSNNNSKVVNKHKRKLIQSSKNFAEYNSNKKQTSRCMKLGSPEPLWFILSGHRIQRKEFQMLIRRLKGRLCRDSHHWSYQATHFIVPDPIRRTEKFFAAAASGRWILKTDYLTASNEAGKFLEEEPFEWYRNGLTEDGAISLEAPRKWRLLRERTGHGAYYGMRIIIYGDCIAPTLDTLKRAVKAGDGTILATAPPYSRFLTSGVDFAIISPGTPIADAWVQEFLRNEIPCVLADYLVEYVCKPCYSLERHVLYNTHTWAEKSFSKLSSLSEQIIIDTHTTSEESAYDIGCVICGSCDRGEAMLVCGGENGSIGCGVGAHMDCCNPPLDAVPGGGWFCDDCRSRASKKPLCATKISSNLKCK